MVSIDAVKAQKAGLAVAPVAIYLLSME